MARTGGATEPVQPPRPGELVWRLANAGFAARCLHVVAELAVADRIDVAPVPVAELAAACGVDADSLDRSQYPGLRRLADSIPQTPESEQAVLYLELEASPT